MKFVVDRDSFTRALARWERVGPMDDLAFEREHAAAADVRELDVDDHGLANLEGLVRANEDAAVRDVRSKLALKDFARFEADRDAFSGHRALPALSGRWVARLTLSRA